MNPTYAIHLRSSPTHPTFIGHRGSVRRYIAILGHNRWAPTSRGTPVPQYPSTPVPQSWYPTYAIHQRNFTNAISPSHVAHAIRQRNSPTYLADAVHLRNPPTQFTNAIRQRNFTIAFRPGNSPAQLADATRRRNSPTQCTYAIHQRNSPTKFHLRYADDPTYAIHLRSSPTHPTFIYRYLAT